MRCEYCGYIGEKEDFEEGKDGFWCPMCDGVLYKEGKESFSQTHVILEQSKLKNSTPVQKSKLKKRLSPLRYPGGKSKLIDQLNELDSGFEEVFARVKEELELHRSEYKDEIFKMQELIRMITDKSLRIQQQELQNKKLMEQKFASVRKQVREVRQSQKVVNQYYKSMMKANYQEPQFLDNKK